MQLNNYGKAYEAYQQAVYRDGKNPAYWCSIGVLYFNINQFHDALDAYTRAVRIHPFIPEIWQNLGTLYESCHDQLADATDAYQRANQLDPSNTQLTSRLTEVRNALMNGTDIAQAPPPPLDIMPDSKSWSNIHFDLAGAKPVYLDTKGMIGNQFSPEVPQDPGMVPSPSSTAPPVSATTAGYIGGGSSNGLRRNSLTRPVSANSNAPPHLPSGYPPQSLDNPISRSSHAPASAIGRIPFGASEIALESERSLHDPTLSRRSTFSSRPVQSDRNPSPPTAQDIKYRHGGSPVISPRLRAFDYDFPPHSRYGYQTPGDSSEAEWERTRPRERMLEGDRGRNGPTSGAVGNPLGRSPPIYSGNASTSASFGRDYDPSPSAAKSAAKRRLSPPAIITRSDEGVSPPMPGQHHSASNSTRVPSRNPYDHYSGSLAQVPTSAVPPSLYYDHNQRHRDTRYASLDARERKREVLAENEFQARRYIDEEERRHPVTQLTETPDRRYHVAPVPPRQIAPGIGGKSRTRRLTNGHDASTVPSTAVQASASGPIQTPGPQPKEKKKRMVGGVPLEPGSARRNVNSSLFG